MALLSARNSVEAVEFAHVANPVGLEDGLAAGDGQGMEGADRPLRVLLQVVEERRVITILHALEDGEVQLEQLLDGVEDAAQGICLRVAGDVFDVPVGQQVEIQLRPHALQRLRQVQCRDVRRFPLVRRFRKRAQDRCIVPRAEREAFVDHDGGQLGVEHRGAECVLEAADEDRLVDEGIQRPAKAAPLCGRGLASVRRVRW